MKEFKGTKGDWKANNIKGFPRMDSLPEIRVNGNLIAKTGGGELVEVEANAKLIASAPELLEACLKLIEVWEADGEGGEIQKRTPIAYYKALTKAEKAISKALGEE